MASIQCSFDHLVGLHTRIAVLESKLEQALEAKATLEKAAAHYMCQSYLGSGIPSTHHQVARLAPADSQGSSGSVGEQPTDLLSLDETSGSLEVGASSTAVCTGTGSVEHYPKKPKDITEDRQKLPEKFSDALIVTQPQVEARSDENLLHVQDERSHQPVEGRVQPNQPDCNLERFRRDRCDFDLWGIRFIPPTTLGGTRMRVVLTNLPQGTTLGAVMEHIRGGSVIECLVVDTARLMGGTWSALVRFRDAGVAERLEKHYQESPLHIGDQQITIKVVQTASYPLPSSTRMPVYNYGHTRCLRIGTEDPQVRQSVGDTLQRAGLMLPHVLEAVVEHPNGRMDVRFASVWYAQRAMEVAWRLTRTFRDIWYTEDPCSRPFPPPTPPEPLPEARDDVAVDPENPEEIYASLGMKHWTPPNASGLQTEPSE